MRSICAQGLSVLRVCCKRKLSIPDREVANAFDAAVTGHGKKKRGNTGYQNIRIGHRLDRSLKINC